MKLEQFTYPFSQAIWESPNINGYGYSMFKLTFQKKDDDQNKRVYKHLGIERPHAIPLSELEPSLIEVDNKTIEGVINWPIIVMIDPEEGANNALKREQQRFYITDQEKFEVRLNNGEAVRVYLSPQEKENKYLIINASYEIAN